jgi:hypothetical protein
MHKLLVSTAVLVLTLFPSFVSAQSCPSGLTQTTYQNVTITGTFTLDACCRLPYATVGEVSCTRSNKRGSNGVDTFTTSCIFTEPHGTYTVPSGTNVQSLQANVLGGPGGDVTVAGKAVLGGQPRYAYSCLISNASKLTTVPTALIRHSSLYL